MSIFSNVPLRKPKSTSFNLSHTVYSTTTFGRLVPTQVEDMMPSDFVKCRTSHKVRFLPMLTPPFGQCYIKSRSFFVPYRLVVPKWEDFITGYYEKLRNGQVVFQATPNLLLKLSNLVQPNSYVRFLFSSDRDTKWPSYGRAARNENLLDYLRIQFPNAPTTMPNVEMSKILAFWKIYFDYFVDENLGHAFKEGFGPNHYLPRYMENSSVVQEGVQRVFTYDDFMSMGVVINGVSGWTRLSDALEKYSLIDIDCSHEASAAAVYNLLSLPNITYQKDYFTSALPWAQKGQPVTLPIFNSETLEVSDGIVSSFDGMQTPAGQVMYTPIDESTTGTPLASRVNNVNNPLKLKVSGQVVNVSNLNPVTINDLRVSFRLQEWLERNARGGSRYIEQIQSHFGVRPQDYRLQRAEYIGGSMQPIVINEVLQTSETSETGSPLGTMGGHSVTVGSARTFKYKAYEHGVLLTISYVTVKPIYFQGVDRRNTRVNFYDFCFPEFAHLGEQSINTTEIYSSDSAPQTFGFQSRYAEYKHERDVMCGGMTSSAFRSWMFGVRDFSSQPQLTSDFVTVDPVAESSLLSPFPVVDGVDDVMLVESYNDTKMTRPLPKYGVPYM